MKINKYSRKAAGILAAFFLLAGCTASQEETERTNNEAVNAGNQNAVPVQTPANQLSDEYYPALIVDGKYQPSQNRGVSLNLNSAVNMKDFESDLLALAKKAFPTDEYYFQEGQIISAEKALSWVSRKSGDNPSGLNPEDNGKIKPEERNPEYLSQIIEQDFMVKKENGFELGGLAIGLAMNQIDYYSIKDENNNFHFYEQPLDIEQVLKEGQNYGNSILSRLRDEPGLENLPIVIGVYLQSPKDSLAGGVYMLEGKSSEGRRVEEWVVRNDRKVVFPNLDGDESEDFSRFDNFKEGIQSFFPNLSGVTGVGYYQGDQLQTLQIEIMTQFYGETEIIAFAQHVTDAAAKYLPQNVQLEIKVQSINGIEAFLSRQPNSQTIDYHIFD